jgi:dTDP-4-dehydrorhamnose 3,5-epimerase
MIEIQQSQISGCFEVYPKVFQDERGTFVKTFHAEFFAKMGLQTKWAEEYYSVSRKGVLRGLHFQIPPYDHEKLVYCVDGEVIDVVVDLRCDSPTYGESAMFELRAETANIVYIPRGIAHGFYTLSESATMMYKVSTVYAPNHDAGIHWDSVGVNWPSRLPILSQRDSELPPFSNFKSPFVFNPGTP